MKIHPVARQIGAAATVLLLLALTFEGIVGGVGQWPHSFTVGQHVQSAAQVLYGVCALLSIATAIRWREFASPVQLGFIASSVVAAGLASVVWGGGSYSSGMLVGVAALLIASLLVWMLRNTVHPLVNRES
jgi:hypothetical protein